MGDAGKLRVYISHHHSPFENDFTARLEADLTAESADVRTDEDSVTRDAFVQFIIGSPVRRQAFLVVVTPDAVASPWVQREVAVALREREAGRMGDVILVYLQPTAADDIPYTWRVLPYVDATQGYEPAHFGLMRMLKLSGPILSTGGATGPISHEMPAVGPPAQAGSLGFGSPDLAPTDLPPDFTLPDPPPEESSAPSGSGSQRAAEPPAGASDATPPPTPPAQDGANAPTPPVWEAEAPPIWEPDPVAPPAPWPPAEAAPTAPPTTEEPTTGAPAAGESATPEPAPDYTGSRGGLAGEPHEFGSTAPDTERARDPERPFESSGEVGEAPTQPPAASPAPADETYETQARGAPLPPAAPAEEPSPAPWIPPYSTPPSAPPDTGALYSPFPPPAQPAGGSWEQPAGQPSPAPWPSSEASGQTAPPTLGTKFTQASGAQVVSLERVAFTAYHPKEVERSRSAPLLVYLALDDAGTLALVAAQAAERLAGRLEQYRAGIADERMTLRRGTKLRIIPTIPGFHINPQWMDVTWDEDAQQHEFSVRADSATVGHAAEGAVRVYQGLTLRAEIALSIFVTQSGSAGQAPSDFASAIARAYRRVFASYSHRDTPVVESCEAAAQAMGDRYLRDVMTLQSGQLWNSQLMKMIAEADVFQLFWSKNAATSGYVRQEWEYALSIQANRPGFIRPVYWTATPFSIPSALNPLHFESLDLSSLGWGPVRRFFYQLQTG